MKKKIRVIRSANKTIVVYSEPVKEKAAPEPMPQKPFLVREFGTPRYYIMPSGMHLPIRKGRFWQVLKVLYPRAQFVAYV
jgi:hypothetical protein